MKTDFRSINLRELFILQSFFMVRKRFSLIITFYFSPLQPSPPSPSTFYCTSSRIPLPACFVDASQPSQRISLEMTFNFCEWAARAREIMMFAIKDSAFNHEHRGKKVRRKYFMPAHKREWRHNSSNNFGILFVINNPPFGCGVLGWWKFYSKEIAFTISTLNASLSQIPWRFCLDKL